MDIEIPFDELVKLIYNIQITYNPLDDMYKIMKIGDIVYNCRKYQQWKLCDDLYENISSELYKEIPGFIYSQEGLKQKIDALRNQNVCPNSTENDILEHIRNIYISNTGFKYSHNTTEDIVVDHQYIEFMNSLRIILKKVYNKYVSDWDKIEAKYDELNDLVESKFKHLENQEEYIHFTNKIFGLIEEVDELVKSFYKYNKEYIDSGNLDRDYNMCFNIVMAKNGLDNGTIELIKSSIYITNLSLHRLNLNIKITEQRIKSLVYKHL